MDKLYNISIIKTVEKSTLKPSERKFILKLFDNVGIEYPMDLFLGDDLKALTYIDDGALNQLKEISISYLEGNHDFEKSVSGEEKGLNDFIELLKEQKHQNALKTLAFAKSLNNRTVKDSLLEHLDVDLLIKIGEISGSFLNFNPEGPIINPGMSVVIHSLVKKPDKNGKIGIVDSHRSDIDPEMGGRYRVNFVDGTHGLFLLKNMEWSDPEYFIETKGISKGGGKRRKKYSKKKKKSKKKKGKSKRKRSKRR